MSRENPQQMVGYLNRSGILSAWTRHIEEESVREHGWLGRWLKTDGFTRESRKKSATGKVIHLGEDLMRLVCSVDGNETNLECRLIRPLHGIAPGDRVKIIYRDENGDNILESIQELRGH